MQKIIHKVFWAWEGDEEERWINQMGADGWQLVNAEMFRYTFQKGKANEYHYRLTMLDSWQSSTKTRDYIDFVEATGAEHVGSVKSWVYFRKRTGDGAFALESDLASRIAVVQRILRLLYALLAIVLIYLPIGIHAGFSLNDAFVWGVVLMNALMFILIVGGTIKLRKRRRDLRKKQLIHE